MGYKVHLTETIEESKPHLLVNVKLDDATESDMNAVEPIHQSLQAKNLVPSEHLTDMGYSSATNIVESQQKYGVELVSRVMPDTSWQGKSENGVGVGTFELNWKVRKASCIGGKESSSWYFNEKEGYHQIEFSSKDCKGCEWLKNCTKGKRGRTIKVRVKEEHEKLQERREEQETPEYRERLKKRAGVEGTISQAVRGMGLRQARYKGKEKVFLQGILAATAINLKRVVSWLRGVPREGTRISRFAALAA